MDVQSIRAVTEAVRAEVRKAVVGQDEVIDLLLTSLLVGGHILLEGVPGTAKTLITRAFGAGLALQFGRIQFTPDLMPGDVLGTNLFNFQTNTFILTKGAIFTQLLLADEINRTPPKTQAALLQAMNERAVTIDGKDYSLGESVSRWRSTGRARNFTSSGITKSRPCSTAKARALEASMLAARVEPPTSSEECSRVARITSTI